jgi:hypothetical protein
MQHFAAGMPMRAAKLQAKRMQRQAARAQATATEEVTRQKVRHWRPDNTSSFQAFDTFQVKISGCVLCPPGSDLCVS